MPTFRGFLLVILFAFSALAGTVYSIATVAGSNPSNDFGLALNTLLEDVHGLALDSQGNLFIADTSRHRVLRVTPTGNVTVVAGTGRAGFSGDGGPADQSMLNQPYGLAVQNATLYI